MRTRSEPMRGGVLMLLLACGSIVACAGAVGPPRQSEAVSTAPGATGSAGPQLSPDRSVPPEATAEAEAAQTGRPSRLGQAGEENGSGQRPAGLAPEAPVSLASPTHPPLGPANGENRGASERNVRALDPSAAAATLDLLAFRERVREMSAGELARQAARLSEAQASVAGTLALAVVLAQTHNPGDLVRALALVEPLARSTDPATAPWQAIARWLAANYAEQRRLEEQIERQAQQLREQQRRLDQLSEKLAALKAIERSLLRMPSPGSRPPLARVVPK